MSNPPFHLSLLAFLILMAYSSNSVRAHFFAEQGLFDIQEFVLEQRMGTIFGQVQSAQQVCEMEQGPYCNGLEVGNSVSK